MLSTENFYVILTFEPMACEPNQFVIRLWEVFLSK